MDDPFPLLDVDADLDECEAILRDLGTTMQELLRATDGHYPPGGAQFCQGIAQLLLLLKGIVPPALRQTIAAEREDAEQEAARWEQSEY